MTILDYHRLRDEESQGKKLDKPADLPDLEDLGPGELCDLYLRATPVQRTYMRLVTSHKMGQQLESFAVRSVKSAARDLSEHKVRLALVAQAVNNLASGDARDVTLTTCLIFHVAKRIGMDAKALFAEVAAISGPAMSALFLDYAKRHPDLQALRMMGWREIETPEGVSFKFC